MCKNVERKWILGTAVKLSDRFTFPRGGELCPSRGCEMSTIARQ